MPTFNDSNNIPPIVPVGDYVFCVVDFESKISAGAKTAGCESYNLTLEIEPNGSKCWETLTDHPSTAWKIDTFLKSAGIKLARGEHFDFRETEANALGYTHVNPIGLRGWCRLTIDTYQGKEKNKVVMFYTDKPKLPRRVEVAAQVEDDDIPF
jgi:hypothetical protein